jgi:hypothetical protein
LYFLNYLAFFRPEADRAVSVRPWVVSRGRLYGLLWAGSVIQKENEKEEEQSNSGIFSSDVSTAFSQRLFRLIWREDFSADSSN